MASVVVVPVLAGHKQRNAQKESGENQTQTGHAVASGEETVYTAGNPFGPEAYGHTESIETENIGIVAFTGFVGGVIQIY